MLNEAESQNSEEKAGKGTETVKENLVELGGESASSPANGAVGKAQTPAKSEQKDYTTELPMFDLEEIVAFVSDIHTKGLERARMPDVAKAFGYEAASSTSFYRKLVSARLFGLLAANGSELTDRARDYVAPTEENSKAKSLIDSVQGIPYFAEILATHGGKRLNVELASNDIARRYSLTKGCGKRCAKVFESSVRFAGLLSPENQVLGAPAKASPGKDEDEAQSVAETEHTQKHTLYLDKQKHRKFHMVAPLTVTTAELERIKNWLTFTIILEDNE